MNRELLDRIRSGYDERKRAFDDLFVLAPWLRRVSFYPTAAFVQWGVSATQATYVSLLFGVLAWPLLAHGGGFWMFAGVVCVWIWSLMDYVDGNIARFSGTSSSYGKFLDDFGGVVIQVGTFYAIGLGLYRDPPKDLLDPGVYLVAGSLTSLTLLLSSALHLKFHAVFSGAEQKSADEPKAEGSSLLVWIYRNVTKTPGIVLPLMLLAAVLGRLDVFILFYAVVFVGSLLLNLVLLTRKASVQG